MPSPRVFVVVSLVAVVLGCGDSRSPQPAGARPRAEGVESAPALAPPRTADTAPYLYEFEFLPRNARSDRTDHVRRVLDDFAAGAPVSFLGREMSPYGTTAVRAWFAVTFFGVERTPTWTCVDALLDAGEPPRAASALDLALATEALQVAHRDAAVAIASIRRTNAPQRRSQPTSVARLHARHVEAQLPAVSRALTATAVRLAALQHADGSWGGPVETTWALLALRDTALDGPEPLRERLGDAWRDRATALAALWDDDTDAARVASVVGLHRIAAVAIADRLAWPDSYPRRGEMSARLQRRLRGFVPDESPEAWLAAAGLWAALIPDRDPDNPLAPTKARFRELYESGALRSTSPDTTLALAAALEWFGYDDFGSISGYLRSDDWPTPRDE